MSKNNGSYRNLKMQADKITRHCNQGSITTRRRYEQSFNRFCQHLGKTKVQNIKNIQAKHLYKYAEDLQKRGVSPAYIKTEMSGIRFYHDRIDNPRLNKLPTNKELELKKRSYKNIDRKWTDKEVNNFKKLCEKENKQWMSHATDLGRKAGLRISEVLKLDKEALQGALKNGYFLIKGKGGRYREVPLKDELRATVEVLYAQTEDYSKVFIPTGGKTHIVKKQLQDFIRDNRDKYTNPELVREPNLTFHGLRHSYAQEEYFKALKEGYEVLGAEEKVSNLLGHNRPEVTKLYFGK